MTETISVLNTETGQVDKYSARLFANKRIFPEAVFKQVEDGQKSYVPELYRARSVEEYNADHPATEDIELADEEVADSDPEDYR